jgi:hypothetical protein
MRRFTAATVIALALSGASTTAAVAASASPSTPPAATAASSGQTHAGLAHHRRGGGFVPQTATRGAVPVARPVSVSADGPSSKPAVFVAGAISSLLVAASALAVLGRRRLARTFGLA